MTPRADRNEIIEEALSRLLAGERADDILASYPGEGAELWPLLQAAGAVVHAPAPQASPSARQAALSRMLTLVAEQGAAPAPAGVLAWLGTLRARPLAYQAVAVVAAVVLFAGLGIGASAATGTTPEPVRTFFRFPDDSGRTTHLQGVVVSASDTALVLDTGAGQTSVALAPTTLIHRGAAQIAPADLRPGERVQVTVHERGGQTTVVRIDVLPPPAATAGAGSGGPVAGPTGEHADATAPKGTPQADQTSGPGDHGGGPAEATRTGTPAATKTPEADQGGDGHGSATPNATRTLDSERSATPLASRTAKPTKTPDTTPEPSETHTSGN